MTDQEKAKEENIKAAMGCVILVGELLICTGVGGVFGWAVGTATFGATLILHMIRSSYKMKKKT